MDFKVHVSLHIFRVFLSVIVNLVLYSFTELYLKGIQRIREKYIYKPT